MKYIDQALFWPKAAASDVPRLSRRSPGGPSGRALIDGDESGRLAATSPICASAARREAPEAKLTSVLAGHAGITVNYGDSALN